MARSNTVTNLRPQETLEDIITAFVDAVPNPTKDDLTEWIKQHPQFRQELIEFAASRALIDLLPPVAPERPETELVEEGRRIGREVLRRATEQRAVEDPLPASLLAHAREQGTSVRDLAKRTGLSVAIVRKLDRRLIRAQSMPRRVIGVVAQAVRVSSDTVRRYLEQPPTFAVGAQYRSDVAPRLAEQEDFFDAVREDRSLTDEHRAFLLSLDQPGSAETDA